MVETPSITNVRFEAAGQADLKTGLVGWITFRMAGLVVDGVTVRITADGRLTLSFPGKKDRYGKVHHHLRPIDDAARCHIEREVFAALPQGIVS